MGEAANFFAIGVFPDGAVARLAEFPILGDFSGVGVYRMSMEGKVGAVGFIDCERGLRRPCIVEEEHACACGDVGQAGLLGACDMWMESHCTLCRRRCRFGLMHGLGGGEVLFGRPFSLFTSSSTAGGSCAVVERRLRRRRQGGESDALEDSLFGDSHPQRWIRDGLWAGCGLGLHPQRCNWDWVDVGE